MYEKGPADHSNKRFEQDGDALNTSAVPIDRTDLESSSMLAKLATDLDNIQINEENIINGSSDEMRQAFEDFYIPNSWLRPSR